VIARVREQNQKPGSNAQGDTNQNKDFSQSVCQSTANIGIGNWFEQ
jgi:hypothetical protein